ncbi:MAG TPA: hypothetical protein DIT49_02510, partial [Clostridiales bacterium]|nr:hypothetical protein [Clostridiales bacterium]
MYLKALEIQGFKSFADKTVLSFGEDITAIVGPNGSGKSNIADAIRWVMGEQSTRTLRGSKMEDVIFDGTAKRKGLGFAEVSLVLDNTDHIFPREETEVAITRRYYRSGESEYYINRHSCRLRDINELLMDTGLGREGYSIIGQGRIDEILSIKSADRREVFEEAAGISRFRHRKEEAERKLERTQDNLVRINDKISELELQVEPLRVQAEKTRQYLRYREELRGLEVSVWMAQLEELRARSLVLQRDYDTAVSHREDARRALEELYTAGEEFSAQMRGKDIHAEELRGEQAQLEQGIHSCEGEINLLHNDMRNNSENMARIREEQAQQEGRAGSLHQQIEERRARLEEIEREMERCRAGMGQVSREVQRTLHSSGTLSEELEQLRERERLEQASAAEVRQLLSALTAAAQELLDQTAPGESCKIPLIQTQPDFSGVSGQLYQDLLSSVVTPLDGVATRGHNVALAASSCNGKVIMPGQVFSYLGAIGNPSVANGYQTSTGYANGETVDMVGGGICQVSSSIYYCTVYANLEIVYRANHAFVVGYVPNGLDATVYYPSLDYKFRNNTGFPIKIVSYVSGGRLTVQFYGTKTDGSYVKTERNTLDTVPWETVYQPDSSIPRGTTKVKTTPYTGYTVEVYRLVYNADGSLRSRTFENKSRYSKRDKVILF